MKIPPYKCYSERPIGFTYKRDGVVGNTATRPLAKSAKAMRRGRRVQTLLRQHGTYHSASVPVEFRTCHIHVNCPEGSMITCDDL